MESDRIETNLGPTDDQDIEPEPKSVPKQPKRRFVGRKTADQLAQQNARDGSIEDTSSTLQGNTQTPLLANPN
jgi:2-(3-amino-3-carboxypropyl)histidine synthase